MANSFLLYKQAQQLNPCILWLCFDSAMEHDQYDKEKTPEIMYVKSDQIIISKTACIVIRQLHCKSLGDWNYAIIPVK